ncbi:OLC1v1025213C1 [Oldenlandia corymbosa var. corymbosa]|uniref:OLC1v1025213C1 n=1 Tax=Oldenlandia corymbosa var. corymbosa TaxID=529605 RepID=A0AAV1C5M3_OLDCO|nr:OLC1v1025213C1 [Oldenlandia corymbosa var. corymbosa]
MTCGFGFSNKSNQYTVLTMFARKQELCCCPITGKEIFSSQMAEVHVLGTSSWRCIDHAPYSGRKLKFMIYLSGSVYWTCDESKMIYSFDFKEAKFRAIEPPPSADMWPAGWYMVTLGMLGGRLSLCRTSIGSDELRLWVLGKNGLTAWTEFKTIHLGGDDSAFLYSGLEFGLCKYFRIHLAKAKFVAVNYVPSFISLKDVVQGDCVEILNINSESKSFELIEVLIKAECGREEKKTGVDLRKMAMICGGRGGSGGRPLESGMFAPSINSQGSPVVTIELSLEGNSFDDLTSLIPPRSRRFEKDI